MRLPFAPRPAPGVLSAPPTLRPVDEYHLWRVEDGDAAIAAGRGFEALLLPGFNLRTLVAALRWDRPRRLISRPDGLYLAVDSTGRPRGASGRVVTPGATLAFARIDAFRVS